MLHQLMTTPGGVPVHGFAVPAAQARSWWRRLRPRHATTGLWPLLMDPDTPAELAAMAGDPGPEPWEEPPGRPAALGRPPTELDLDELEAGEWPEVYDRPREPDEGTAVVALLPVAAPWRIPLLLGYGDWNGYPAPPAHAAMLHHFHTRYGAEPVILTRDSLEFTVARPPLDRRAAVALAWDYEMYTDALDLHGLDSLPELAAVLLGATVWRAWWD
ncbi:DUF4253 domain-containing protein [Dactylosporangium sp. McL0621]|uniref:DUF4253 domain-containing protein n=1 Tax=Dactylosporangium sp. McL0621 TaxID=3415678 RepID=UPI003CE82559